MTSPRTVALLFTDLERSTAKWDMYGPAMADALAVHDATVARVLANHDPLAVKHTGDGSMAVFANTADAINAALDLSLAIRDTDWPIPEPLRLRMGIHFGAAFQRDGDWFGTSVSRAARIADAAHAEQILLSHAAHLAAADLMAGHAAAFIGKVHLKGLSQPEPVHQLLSPGLRTEFPPPRAPTATSGHNLPTHLSDFVGRQDDQRALKKALEESRLVTLVGPGGVGKTRLAVEVARQVARDYPDGIWFADLGSTQHTEAVAAVVNGVLGLPEEPIRTPLEVASEWAGSRRALLVLDNCEQVLDGAADLAEAWATGPGGSGVLATSREHLHVPGEQVLQVQPLLGDVDLAFDGVQLFVNRAEAVAGRDLAPYMDTIGELCARLDGLPLAIELAAARMITMTPHEILDGIGSALDLRGARRSRGRHASLRATIEWSYDLLEPSERRVLEAIAAFPDGMPHDAIPHLARHLDMHSRQVADAVEILGERSLLTTVRSFEAPIHRLLDAVRAFAREQGEVSGDFERGLDSLTDALTEFCTGLAGRMDHDPSLMWLVEHFRTSFEIVRRRLVAQGRLDEAVGMLLEIRPYYFHTAHDTGMDHCRLLLGDQLTDLQRIEVMSTLAPCQWFPADQVQARVTAEATLQLCEQAGAPPHPLALSIVDIASALDGQPVDGRASMNAWNHAMSDPSSPWTATPGATTFPPAGWLSRLSQDPETFLPALRNLTNEARREGRVLTLVSLLVASSITERDFDPARSIAAAEEGAAILTTVRSSWWEAVLRVQRAISLSVIGRNREAVEDARESLLIGSRVGDDRTYTAALELIAYFARKGGSPESAVILLGAADLTRRRKGRTPGTQREIANRTRLTESLRKDLGSSFDGHWDRGTSMLPSAVERFALAVADEAGERLRDE